MVATILGSAAITFAAPTAYAQAAKPVAATLRLDWVPGPHHVGPILAAQRGYYAAEGLDIAVRAGRGSGSTVQVVAAGTDMFGFADAGAMAIAISKGAPVIMVANITQLGANGAVTLDRPMASPQDLVGKTIGMVPGEAGQVALAAVAKKHGIPETAYRVISVEAASKTAALLTKRVDVIPGFRFGDYLRAQAQNPNVKIALFSDWGVNLIGNGYFVQTALLDKNPELVQKFLRATMRGWEETIKDPKAGVDALMKEFPDTNRSFVEAGLPLVFAHMHSPATKGKPIGWMADEDWKSTLEVMKGTGLEGDRPTSAFYRNLIK
ncbi:MAG: ABC transporter substrate-binding protein [Burkholderiales bacterium]